MMKAARRWPQDRRENQWPTIHGRWLLPADFSAGPVTDSALSLLGRQQPQFPACARRGALALRSLVAWAVRAAPSIIAIAGTEKIARGARAPQPGQGCGWSYSAIGRLSSNGPQAAQSYS
jgi:hypothetical protein